jgi:hypothetical protein
MNRISTHGPPISVGKPVILVVLTTKEALMKKPPDPGRRTPRTLERLLARELSSDELLGVAGGLAGGGGCYTSTCS